MGVQDLKKSMSEYASQKDNELVQACYGMTLDEKYPQSTLSKATKTLEENKYVVAGTLLQVAAPEAIKLTGKITMRVANKIAPQLTKLVAKKIGSISVKIGQKMGLNFAKGLSKKFGTKIASKIGTKIAEKVALAAAKFAEKSAIKLAIKFGAKLAERLGLKVATKAAGKIVTSMATKAASMGPAGIASLAFDLLSMGLDLGDAGGYMAMGTNKMYKEMKAGIDAEIAKAYKDQGVTDPMIVGPLDKIDEVDINKFIQDYVETQKATIEETANKAMTDFINTTLATNGPIMTKLSDEATKIQDDAVTAFNTQKLAADGKIMKDVIQTMGTMTFNTEEDMDAYLDAQLADDGPVMKQINSEAEAAGLYSIAEKYITDQLADDGPIMTQVKADADAQGITEKVSQTYLDLSNAASDTARKLLCESKGGRLLDNGACTYATKASCDSSYPWDAKPSGSDDWNPVPEGNTYAEWDEANKRCLASSYGMRTICESAGLPYDNTTGICKIDEQYCKVKGADWVDGDCKVKMGQEIAETIFGTTITRGLRQIFDPDQYEKCKEGEIDDGYFCRSVSCDADKEMNAGLCYPKCKPGYSSDGATVCWQTCDSTSKGGPIRINGKCVDIPGGEIRAGQKIQLWDCNGSYAQNFSYNPVDKTIRPLANSDFCVDIPGGNITNGAQMQLWNCNGSNAQQFERTSDGQFKSTKDQGYCIDLYTNSSANGAKINLWQCNGGNAQKWGMDSSKNIGAGCTYDWTSRVADCPDGYTNNGATCGRGAASKSSAPSNHDHGKYITATCPKGYYNDGTSCMFKVFGRGTGYDYFFRNGMRNCENDYGEGNCENNGALAYPKCQKLARDKGYANADKWTNDGCCLCSPESGYRQYWLSEKGECRNPDNEDEMDPYYTNRTGALCYTDCEKLYGSGWYNNGTSCWRDPSTLGMGDMVCKPGEFKSGARCYKTCPPGFKNMGEYCALTKDTYNRGVGSPAVHIRAKKRTTEFSKKDQSFVTQKPFTDYQLLKWWQDQGCSTDKPVSDADMNKRYQGMTEQQIKDDMKTYTTDEAKKAACGSKGVTLTTSGGFLPDVNKKFMLKNTKKNMCLDDGGGTSEGGSKFTMFNCVADNKNQQFVYDFNTKIIKNPNKTNLCLDNGGATTAGGAKTHLWTCNGGNKFQNITYDPTSKLLKFPNLENNLCIDDAGATTPGSAQVHVWTCDANNDNQKFDVVYI